MRIEKTVFGPSPAALSAAPSDHPQYRPDIDGLRAIAVLAVVLFHAFPGWLGGGFVGVDVFFVISGFLISSIIIKGLEQGSFTFARFYARRIKRIFPALILVMGSCFAFGWFALFPDEFAQLGKHIVGGAGFVSNFLFWNEVGYFDTAAETKPLLHLWSLGIEEQFYIAWPVLLLCAWRMRLNLFAVTAALAAASFLVNVVGIAHDASATFYSPASRAWELLAGALLAIAALRRGAQAPVSGRVSPNFRAGAGLALLAIAIVFVSRDRHFPGWLALLPTVGTVLLIGAGPQAWVNRRVLSNPVLVWFGLISYPLYLWHWPLLAFAQIVESQTPVLAIRAAAVLLAVVLAWLTYRLLERPLRGSAGRARVAVLALLMLALAGTGAYACLRDGLPQRGSIVENAQNQKALILVEDVQNAAACKKRYGFASLYEYCLMAQVNQPPTVALIGDSHGYHVVAGVTKYYSSIGENLLFLGTRHPYWGLEPGDDKYQQATQAMLELALKTASIHTVIFSGAVKVEDASPLGHSIVVAMRDTYRRFTAAGKHVIVMHDVPTLDFNPRACIKRAGIVSSSNKWPCAMKRADYDEHVKLHNATVKVLFDEFPMIEQFWPTPSLCDQSYCWAMKNGTMLYRDTNHLSYDGDLYVGERFAAERRAALPRTPEKALK